MSARYRIHFTPHFSGVKDEVTGEIKGDYKFFNKPFGLKHFLEFGEFMGLVDEDTANDANTGGTAGEEIMKMKDPNSVIILCDPDFLLMRPLTDDFSNEKETIVSPRRRAFFENQQKEQQNQNQQQQQQQQSSSRYIVSHGHPFAQTYGLGTQWRKFGIDAITNSTNSPAKDVDQTHGQLLYPAGPPYIGTAEDMYKIAVKWSEFAPRVHKEYPHLLAEMCEY